MPVAEAKSILQCAADLVVNNSAINDSTSPEKKSSPTAFFLLEHDPAADLEALRQLAWALEKFSPVIGLEQDFLQIDNRKKVKSSALFQPSSLLMDVTGLSHLFGGWQALGNQLQTFCQQLGYWTHIGIAPTTGHAWAVAHFSNANSNGVPITIASGDLADIDALPVCALRLPPQSIAILMKLGIETVGPLLQMDRDQLRSRLGEGLLKRLDQMLGEIDEPIVVCRTESQFVAQEQLDYPTNHRETIEVVVTRLVENLCRQMKTHQLGGLQWLVRLIDQRWARTVSAQESYPVEQVKPVELRINLFQPTADKSQVMPLVAMQLEQALLPHLCKTDKRKFGPNQNSNSTIGQRPGGPVSRTSRQSRRRLKNRAIKHYRYTTLEIQHIVVEVVTTVRQIASQRFLFDDANTSSIRSDALAGLINRLSSRLGMANVVVPILRKSAQPESSYRFKPLVDPATARKKVSPTQKRQTTTPFLVSHAVGRPLKLVQPPTLVDVTRAEPTGQTEAAFLNPTRISVSGHVNQTAQRVLKAWGPERIETGWWHGATVRRDYWRIITERGQQFWVFCDLKTNQWFLHGEF